MGSKKPTSSSGKGKSSSPIGDNTRDIFDGKRASKSGETVRKGFEIPDLPAKPAGGTTEKK